MGKRLENLLDAYTAKRQEYDAFQLHCAAQTAEILAAIPVELREALAKVDAARDAGARQLQADIDALAATLKSAVGAAGHTVKGTDYQVVYSRGRVSWDTRALEGYAAAHEELYQFRLESEPTVSIRAVAKPPTHQAHS